VLYLDASAFVKRYVDEGDHGTAAIDEIVGDAPRWGGLVSSEWLLLEVTSALSRKVRTSRIDEAAFDRVMTRFRADLNAINLVSVEPGQARDAARLVEGARGISRFHSGDAIHLHTALQLQRNLVTVERVVLVTTDDGFKHLAAHYRLDVFDPRSNAVRVLAEYLGPR
jgi:predicted nucleic acid-binding protein